MERIMVARASEIPALRSRTVTVGGMEIAIFKLSSGELRAIENRCPHKNGKLSEGIVCDHHVFCPLHDWKINMKDGLVQAPDEGCVTTFSVEVDEEGKVYLLWEKGSLSA
ncbi:MULTISPECIES: nitrite reductase small subunit NirD [unclassified Paenibacillus]|uniref:nitrite reductase small subunit NirD n=1 Tax=unclassified Paenibacillus TaxID=185978 RepID=UPI001AE4C3F2|nr:MULTISPECIES: nitrite reductase small subunit NirD [unclassified Paenibacillus]MBP1157433.1 nitrite reductase (NADH) small subunit [Paenibacillus sp. PvP091]MBP1171829.1 nitrite reductase (NADH) small subunit [Paenibacillus sp. PvR098]MBP2438210.1 nitrite reductase (NADH) small subunit [Paenibacillus sp. PvP052]